MMSDRRCRQYCWMVIFESEPLNPMRLYSQVITCHRSLSLLQPLAAKRPSIEISILLSLVIACYRVFKADIKKPAFSCWFFYGYENQASLWMTLVVHF